MNFTLTITNGDLNFEFNLLQIIVQSGTSYLDSFKYAVHPTYKEIYEKRMKSYEDTFPLVKSTSLSHDRLIRHTVGMSFFKFGGKTNRWKFNRLFQWESLLKSPVFSIRTRRHPFSTSTKILELLCTTTTLPYERMSHTRTVESYPFQSTTNRDNSLTSWQRIHRSTNSFGITCSSSKVPYVRKAYPEKNLV